MNIVCIGLNYADHAAETGAAIPAEPIIFLKSLGAYSGPYDDVVIPKDSTKPDWEVELGVVIGTRAKYVSEADAMAHVAGYCVVNDVSERNFQIERGGNWTKGKSCDTFAPIGPWMVTRDEIPDPQALKLSTTVNGELRQSNTTANMTFGVARLVSFFSTFMTLRPGYVITTGTPGGTAWASDTELGGKPYVRKDIVRARGYLQVGDVVRCEVENIGVLENHVVAPAA